MAGFISVLLTIIGIFLSANPGAQQTMPTFLADPFILLGLSIFIIAIVGLMFKSRIAAIFLLSDFVISKIMILTEAPAGSLDGIVRNSVTIIIAFVFIYFYVRATAGTFVYHKNKKALKVVKSHI